MKKIFSLILAIMLIASLSVAAFATSTQTGTITINGASADNTYSIYKLFDLESYNTASGAYSYKVNSAWTNFFKPGTGALDYVSINEEGYISWTTDETDSTKAAFAKLALAYAKANGIAVIATKSGSSALGTTLQFTDLTLGYYLVDSTMGALCGLTTTNPNAYINAKNSAPTMDKQVEEDSTGRWGTSDTADIGQTVKFSVTINVHDGAESYVLHDEMSEGLTYTQITKIEHVIPTTGDPKVTVVPTDYYTVNTTGLSDDCDFEVVFTQAFCDHLETNDKVIVYYEAMLNRHATIAGDGNANTAWLDFGEGHSTVPSTTYTYTYSIDLVKTDSQNTPIDGAKFRIYDAEVGGNEIAVVPLLDANDQNPVLDEKGNPMYRRARADETGVDILVKDGLVTIVGFDNGIYYMDEIEAPAGYNKITARQKFTIADSNLEATFNNGSFSTGSGVHVVNKTGSMLPETGGFGTMLFTVLGTITVLATGVVLVTKKRLSKIEDAE